MNGTIENLDDVVARLFVGAHLFPGSYMDRTDFSPALGAEIFATPRLVFGFDVSSQMFSGLHLRSAF